MLSDSAPVILIDHAPTTPGQPVALPQGGRAVVMLMPGERDLIAAYRTAGADGYLIKPLRRTSLVERVLAAAGDQTPEPSGAKSVEDDRVAPARFAGVRVLLAEDNPVGALLARTLLRREGCVVETAATGDEAVAAVRRARYDLI
ncbi:hypothetical protein K4A07_17140, partial [Lactiplantibacillus plantarum]|nr:hypothetical protein [Lactiplantibacillus plantarum]